MTQSWRARGTGLQCFRQSVECPSTYASEHIYMSLFKVTNMPHAQSARDRAPLQM